MSDEEGTLSIYEEPIDPGDTSNNNTEESQPNEETEDGNDNTEDGEIDGHAEAASPTPPTDGKDGQYVEGWTPLTQQAINNPVEERREYLKDIQGHMKTWIKHSLFTTDSSADGMAKSALDDLAGAIADKELWKALQKTFDSNAFTALIKASKLSRDQRAYVVEQITSLTRHQNKLDWTQHCARNTVENKMGSRIPKITHTNQVDRETQEEDYTIPMKTKDTTTLKELVEKTKDLHKEETLKPDPTGHIKHKINKKDISTWPMSNEHIRNATKEAISVVSTHLIITLILMLASTTNASDVKAKLVNPGDTATLDDIRLMLHEDQTGNKMISATVTKPAIAYAYAIQSLDLSRAADAETKLQQLLSDLTSESPHHSQLEQKPAKFASTNANTKQACDCHLSTRIPTTTDKTTKVWVTNHREIPHPGCKSTIHLDKYETSTTQSAEGTTCTINPTPQTRVTDILPYQTLDTTRLAEITDNDAKTPCITYGGFNLNKIPPHKIRTAKATNLIHCQAICHFDSDCSDWMYQASPKPNCWLLDLGQQRYRFTRDQDTDPDIYTGDADCLPCHINRRIQIRRQNGWDEAKTVCTLKWNGRPSANMSCPCDTAQTYQDAWPQMAKIDLKARTNSIRPSQTPHNNKNINPNIATILRSLSAPGRHLPQLQNILTRTLGAANFLRKTNPQIYNQLEKIEPIAQIRRLLQPAYAVTTAVVEAAQLRRPHVRNTRTTNTTDRTTITALFDGKLQTKKEIDTALKRLDAFLEETDLKNKRYYSTPTEIQDERSGLHDVRTKIPPKAKALIMTANQGTKTSKIAIFPIETGATTTQTTIIPLPTHTGADQTEPYSPQGTIDIAKHEPNTPRSVPAILMCAMQLAQAISQPTACNIPGPPRRLQNLTVHLAHGQNKTLRLARFCSPGQSETTIQITCNSKLHILRITGTTLLAIPMACAVSDVQGQEIIPNHPGKHYPEETYHILYSGALTRYAREWNEQDTTHITLATAIIILISLRIWSTCTKKCNARHGQIEIPESDDDAEQNNHYEENTPRSSCRTT